MASDLDSHTGWLCKDQQAPRSFLWSIGSWSGGHNLRAKLPFPSQKARQWKAGGQLLGMNLPPSLLVALARLVILREQRRKITRAPVPSLARKRTRYGRGDMRFGTAIELSDSGWPPPLSWWQGIGTRGLLLVYFVFSSSIFRYTYLLCLDSYQYIKYESCLISRAQRNGTGHESIWSRLLRITFVGPNFLESRDLDFQSL